jgi:hypothetical protein
MMTKRLFLGGLLAGVLLFVWGAFYHTVLPFNPMAFEAFRDEDAVARALVEQAPRSGVYILPYEPPGGDEAASKAAQEKLARGPMAFAAVRLGPMGSIGGYLVRQLAIDLLEGLLAALLLLHARPATAAGRALFLAGVALVAWMARSLPAWNWYAFSTAFTLFDLGDMLIGLALAGALLSRFLPKTSAA